MQQGASALVDQQAAALLIDGQQQAREAVDCDCANLRVPQCSGYDDSAAKDISPMGLFDGLRHNPKQSLIDQVWWGLLLLGGRQSAGAVLPAWGCCNLPGPAVIRLVQGHALKAAAVSVNKQQCGADGWLQ